MTKLITFNEALADARDNSDEMAVLLGNGFSIEFAPQVFSYDALAKEASLDALSVDKDELFAALNSNNFEVVIDKLKAGAALARLYPGDVGNADVMEADAKVVRHGLADVLADRHPLTALALTDEEVLRARTFLSNFTRIYTLNYDLLLYWVLNRERGPHVNRADGFEWPTAQRSTRYVWKSKPARPQRVFYLHGALHLFRHDKKLEKLTYWNDGPLIEKLRERLEQGKYPHIVTEGKREEKESRIDKSGYLRTGLRRFGELRGALFIHGSSMSPNDAHIFELIEADSSEIDALYIGLQSTTTKSARSVIARAKEIKEERRVNGGGELRIHFYDSATAHVWR